MKVMTGSMMNQDSTKLVTYLGWLPTLMKIMNTILKKNAKTIEKIIEDITGRNESVDALILTTSFAFLANNLYNHFNCPVIALSPPSRLGKIYEICW